MSTKGVSPYETLASEVVLQAVKDYRDAVKKLAKGKKNSAAESMKHDCERFFKSQHFNLFTELDGGAILSQLEKEVAE